MHPTVWKAATGGPRQGSEKEEIVPCTSVLQFSVHPTKIPQQGPADTQLAINPGSSHAERSGLTPGACSENVFRFKCLSLPLGTNF